ncbi:MAG: DNA mismatch repair endonuclease MutL [Chloroflexi bacterium]|nr:DNA mismatch repair endonuclease MutL [Chloroflexota bacterium]
MPIQVLTPEVAAKIAAGEVVERPASVVKELLENSLDAGTHHITIEARGGGLQLIRITDDGGGIPSHEVELAFHRHATSKLSSDRDLEAIVTLGFRGEALPSIAAVAEVRLVTRTANEMAGYQVQIQGGATIQKGKAACPVGTTVTVRQLFHHLPARLKFLRSAATEGGHISSLVHQYALAFPEVAFVLLLDGREAFRSPGSGQLREVAAAVYSAEVAGALLEVDSVTQEGEVPTARPRLWGLVSPPSLSRASPAHISTFVNRRWVHSGSLRAAVAEAYRTHLMVGRHPIAILHLALPPAEVDVNVHPAKREVRFRLESAVFVAVKEAVAATLNRHAPVPSLRVPPPFESPPHHRSDGPDGWDRADRSGLDPGQGRPWAPPPPLALHAQPTQGMLPDALAPQYWRSPQAPVPAPPGAASGPPAAASPAPAVTARLPVLRVMGQIASTYIVAEGPDGVYLVDQHAAHERVLYEQLRSQQKRRQPQVQGMLQPATVELSPHSRDSGLEEQRAALAAYGFDIEHFGDRTYLVRSVPAVLAGKDVARVLPDLLDTLKAGSPGDWADAIAISLACHGAVKAGQSLGDQEMRGLLRELEACESPRTCPHGRPIMLHLSQAQLEREFGRH